MGRRHPNGHAGLVRRGADRRGRLEVAVKASSASVATRRVVGRCLAVLMLVLPRLAEACPMCASQQPGGVARIVALGVMMLSPFAMAYVMFRPLRRGGGASAEDSNES